MIPVRLEKLGPVTPEEMSEAVYAIASEYGQVTDVVTLHGKGGEHRVPIHTEMNYLPTQQRCSMVILGCVRPAQAGGETIVYDGAEVAERLSHNSQIKGEGAIVYRSPHHVGKTATHALVQPEGVIFMEQDRCAQVDAATLPEGLTPDEYFRAITTEILASDQYTHRWQSGDVLVLDNTRSLHSRQPYVGLRHLVRARV